MIDSLKITGRQIDDKDKATELETIIPGYKISDFSPGVVTMKYEDYNLAKDITNRLEKVCEQMCDKYCKYPNEYGEDEYDNMLDDICNDCPLNQLI